jgi:hypothetical protein
VEIGLYQAPSNPYVSSCRARRRNMVVVDSAPGWHYGPFLDQAEYALAKRWAKTKASAFLYFLIVRLSTFALRSTSESDN